MDERIIDQVKSLKFHINKLKRLVKEAGLQMKAEIIVRSEDTDLQAIRVRQHWDEKSK